MKKFLAVLGVVLVLLGLFCILFKDNIENTADSMWYTSERDSPTRDFLYSVSDFAEEAGYPFLIIGGVLLIVSAISNGDLQKKYIPDNNEEIKGNNSSNKS